MQKNHLDPKSIRPIPQRSSSSGNLLAKRLYRNNSLTRLNPLNSNTSFQGSLNTSLIPSISLRKLIKVDHSPPSIEISQGKILLKRHEELPFLSQTGSLLKKKAALRKFEKIDIITEKSIVPQELKSEIIPLQVKEQTKKFKPSRKWLAKLKQGKETLQQKLTPQDFIQLIQEQGGLGNEFCYLQKGDHPYDLKIVEFGGVTGDQYITISARGVTYFNWEGSRFVSLQEWRREAYLFNKLMKLQFFGKYKLHKNFTNWKKYSRKIGMKKMTDKLKVQLLVHDRHLRQALLNTRDLCCKMQKQNYCCFDDSAPALNFSRFKAAQESYLQDQFEKRINQIEEEIKYEVANSLSVSMRDFKEQNKISSGKQAKGLPLLIGDEKNLQMPYTKQATLRVQQQKFKRFLKLIELLVIHSKVAMMNESTHATARKLEEQNENYREYLNNKSQKGKDNHFKGKQYIECQMHIEEREERAYMRPSREELTNLMQDIVNKSIIKLVRNHQRIINDPDINAILYEGAEEQNKEIDNTNSLKLILGSEEKQEEMVNLLIRSISTSYNYLEDFVSNLSPLIAQYFKNQNQLNKIAGLSSEDYFIIRQWIQKWRKQLQQIAKLNQQHQSAVFVLNFKTVKEMAIQCSNLCLSKMKEIVPKILQTALRRIELQLKQSLRLMEISPIGIEVFIVFQQNKINITSRLQSYDDTLGQIGQLIQILKQLGSSGETAVLRGSKQRKQLGETLKSLRAKIEQAEMHSKVHQVYAQEEVRKMIPKVFQALQTLYTKTKLPRVDAKLMKPKIIQWKEEFLRIERQLQKLKEYQRFLNMEQINQDKVSKFALYFNVYESIWGFSLKVEKYHESLLIAEWKNMQIENVKRLLESFLSESETLKKDVLKINHDEEFQIQYTEQNVVNSVVADIKKKIKPLLQAIECLRDSSIQQREQRFIRAELQKKEKIQLAQVFLEKEGTVSDLVRLGLIDQLDFLKKIVFKSKKQLELNYKMATVSKFWGQSASHSSKNLIDNFSQHYWTLAEEIDEKITVINCVREDPQIEEGQFKNRVQNQKNMFDSLRLLLGQWEKHHNFLTYFEPIFANPYWKGTSEFKSYTYAESNWKKLTKQISKDFSLRKLASQEKKHLSILRENNIIFQDLKYAVQMFLNAKRQAFPKLYFLSDQELLRLLLQDKDYSSIDKHLTRIFPNLKSLELNEERNCPISIKNMVNESLTLRPSPVKQILELQQGLRVIEQRMKQGIKSGLLKCSNYYMQDDFSRSQWIKQNILQVLLFIGNAQFTKLLEYDYLQADGQDPSQLLTYQLSQIKQLHNMIREQIHNQVHLQNNYKLSVLLMQAAHFRDIILKIIQQGVTDDNSFQWLRQVRSYYNGNDVAVTKYFTKSIEYGYEFVCPNYSFTLATLSQRQIIEVVNTAGLGYLPVLKGCNRVIQLLCTSNARSHFSLSLKTGLSSSYIQNVCQGALSSSTYLQLQGMEYFLQSTAAIISSFILQARNIIERRQAFHLSVSNKAGQSLPSFNIFLRIHQQSEIKPIQEHLKISFRTVKVPEISIYTYLSCITELAYGNADTELAAHIEKCCDIINSCSAYKLIGLQQIRSFFVSSVSPTIAQFKQNIVKCFLKQINSKVVEHQQIRFLQGLVREMLAGNKSNQPPKTKVKTQWNSKILINYLVETMKKKQACVLAGPSYAGKKYLVFQAYKASGLEPAVFYTDLLPKEQFLGNFQNGLWKEGILSRYLKKLSYSQEQWIIFVGQFSKACQQLAQGAVEGHILQLNGQNVYLSPNWKFLFLSDAVMDDCRVAQGCEVITSDRFIQFDEQLQYLLQSRISSYFKTNIEGFTILKNLCINNFQKILKFRLKGRFLRSDHIINCFISVLESILARSPEKQLEQKQNQLAIEKLFLYSIFWTVNTALTADQSKKFEAQIFEQIKIEFDRSQPLNLCKFQFDSPQGSLKRVQQPLVHLNQSPYFVSQQLEAISKFVEILLANNKHVLLIGEETSGKSQFLKYLRQNLSTENYSFLKIRFSQGMAYSKFEELIRRKAKIVINSFKEKHLCAINGKQLILILEDINLVQEEGEIGRLLKSILSVGYYYDTLTLDKIYIGNVAILAAENSAYEFRLSYDFTRNFKPIYVKSPSIRDIIQLYHPLFPSQYSVQLCHNIASLHEFSLLADQEESIYFKKTISIPCRILNTLKSYNGKENIVKIWQYLSVKFYVKSNPTKQSFNSKIIAEIKNYTNLMLKNNQQEPSPIENSTYFIKQLNKHFPIISLDQTYSEYYVYVAMILQLSKPFHLFTINQPLCASYKEEILFHLCAQNEVQYIHPFTPHQMIAKCQIQGRLVIYLSDKDECFNEIVGEMLSELKENLIYFVDFTNDKSWRDTIDKHPSLITFGCRYYKEVSTQQKYQLTPEYLKPFQYYLELFQRQSAFLLHEKQQVCKLIDRNDFHLRKKVESLIEIKQKICANSRSLNQKIVNSQKELENLHNQLQQLAKAEQKKRRELLQLKNSYQGQLTEAIKLQRAEKIQVIQVQLTDIMSQRRANEDHSQSSSEKLSSHQKIVITTKHIIERVERELKIVQTISQNIHKIIVFLSIVEYFYTKGDKKYDASIETTVKTLPLDFQQIMLYLFGCAICIQQKQGVLWLLYDKSIIIEDQSQQFVQFLQRRYKNVHVIRQMKDLEDISQLQEEKAYVLVGEMRSEATYLNDLASSQKLKRQQTKQREQRVGKDVKDDHPDYNKNIYFIFKEHQGQQRLKENSQIQSQVSVKSRELRQDSIQATRRTQRKATRMNTLRNTLSLTATTSGYINLKKQQTKYQKQKEHSDAGNFRQQATIRIKYKEVKQGDGAAKGEQDYQDYLIAYLENQFYYGGGKRVTMVQTKFHKNIPNVTFICKKTNTRDSRQTLHKFQPFNLQPIDKIFQQLLQTIDPAQTNAILSIQQQLDKITTKCNVQQKIVLQKYLEATPKSFNQIAKNGDFLQSIYENMKSLQQKLTQVRNKRVEPYAAYFKYCQVLKDYEPLLKIFLPYYRGDKFRLKKIILDSIKYNDPTERDGVLIEPQYKIDENQSICKFRSALIKEIIINQSYIDSLYAITLLCVLLQVRQGESQKSFINAFIDIIKQQSNKPALQKLLNQKHCTKQLMKLLESYLHSTDFIYNCHLYLTKKLDINFEKQYSQTKPQWKNITQSFVAIASPGTDPYSDLISQKKCLFIKQNTDHSKCIETMSEKSMNKLVMVNFIKDQSYSKILALFQELSKEGFFSIILLFTSEHTYKKCAFMHKVSKQRIIIVDQIRTPSKRIASILDKTSRINNNQCNKALKLILFNELHSYFKRRLNKQHKKSNIQGSSFYNSQFLLSLLAQAKIQSLKQMSTILGQTILTDKEDVLKQIRKWGRKQQQEALGKTLHSNQFSTYEQTNSQFNHFLNQDLQQIKSQLIFAISCQDFARAILSSEESKLLTLDIFYGVAIATKNRSFQQFEEISLEQKWNYVEKLQFQPFKTIQTNNYRKQSDAFKSVIRKINLSQFILYNWVDHQVKTLKATNKKVILTKQTNKLLNDLIQQKPCFGLNCSLDNFMELMQKRIYYFEELYNNGQALKKLNLQYFQKFPHFSKIYLYSANKNNDLTKDQIFLKVVSEKQDKQKGWVIGEVELNNCKYDAIRNCLQINDKNQIRRIPRVILAFGEKQTFSMQTLSLPLIYRGQQWFRLELGSKLKDDSGVSREKVFGVIKPIE